MKDWNKADIEELELKDTQQSPFYGGSVDATYVDQKGNLWTSFSGEKAN